MVFLGWCMVSELNEFGSDNDSERHQIFNTKVANLDPSNFEDLSASQILISWVHLCRHLWSKALYLSSLSFWKLPIRMHLCQSYAFVPLILMWLHASANYLNTIDNCKHKLLFKKHQHRLKGSCVWSKVGVGVCWRKQTKCPSSPIWPNIINLSSKSTSKLPEYVSCATKKRFIIISNALTVNG